MGFWISIFLSGRISSFWYLLIHWILILPLSFFAIFDYDYYYFFTVFPPLLRSFSPEPGLRRWAPHSSPEIPFSARSLFSQVKIPRSLLYFLFPKYPPVVQLSPRAYFFDLELKLSTIFSSDPLGLRKKRG